MQGHINRMLHAEIANLELSVAMLDNQVVNLQRQLSLRCDLNVIQFCVTLVY